MRLTGADIGRFRDDGYIFLPRLFGAAETEALRRETGRIAGLTREEALRDERGELRLAMAMERYSPLFARLLRHPRLLEPARRILGAEVYAHQYKIVPKDPLGKLDFPWRQDAASWCAYDGMPAPPAMNYAVFLDDATEFNGPLAPIPGTHRGGVPTGADTPLAGGKSPLLYRLCHIQPGGQRHPAANAAELLRRARKLRPACGARRRLPRAPRQWRRRARARKLAARTNEGAER